jgi:glc operon protein GlcG
VEEPVRFTLRTADAIRAGRGDREYPRWARRRADSKTYDIYLEQEKLMPDAPQLYGPPIALEAAKKVAAPALAEATRNNWAMAVAVVDTAGDLVYFERMDATQIGSARVSVDKARSAARFKRPTKAFQDTLAGGGDGLRVLGIKGAVPVEGGIPIVVDGKIVGAIGISGGTSAQDGQCARAALESMR